MYFREAFLEVEEFYKEILEKNDEYEKTTKISGMTIEFDRPSSGNKIDWNAICDLVPYDFEYKNEDGVDVKAQGKKVSYLKE